MTWFTDSRQMTPKSNNWKPAEQQLFFFFFRWAVTSHVRVTSVFRSPVTPVLQRCAASCSPALPVHLLRFFSLDVRVCHDGGVHNVWFNMLFSIGWLGGDFEACENRRHGVWAAYFLRVERRCEAAEGGGGHLDLHHHQQHRYRRGVRDLLWWMWALCGAWNWAGLVLWHRTETHLLSLRHRGPLSRTHCDPSGHQSNRSQGKEQFMCCIHMQQLFAFFFFGINQLWTETGCLKL